MRVRAAPVVSARNARFAIAVHELASHCMPPPRRGALAHQSKACERHLRARVIATSSSFRPQILNPRGFHRAYVNGMAVALMSTPTLIPATAMSLLIAVRRTLYALFSVRFIEMQKKPVRVR
jgi:hypothetical protein